MKSFYEILEVDAKASEADIKRAYFLMAKKYHPDSGDAAEVKKFYQVSEAYQTLSDAKKRQAYDLSIKPESLATPLHNDEPTPSVTRTTPMSKADRRFREKEKAAYQKNLFLKAVFRVILTTLVFGVLGYSLSILLAGSAAMGLVAGLAFGFFWSANHHFELTTFIPDPGQRELAFYGSGAVMLMSAIYFLFLLIASFL